MPTFALKLYQWTAPSAKGAAKGRGAARPKRPDGPLVWLVPQGPGQMDAAMRLADRLGEAGDLACLVTGDDDEAGAADAQVSFDFTPPDTARSIAEFLDHWSPQVIVLMGNTLPPVLIAQARGRGIGLVLAEAEAPHLPRGREWILPGLLRRSAQALHSVLAVDETAARAYRRLRVANVQRVGRMDAGSLALPYNEAERVALAASFATRPVWLAVDVPIAEEEAVIAAHRAALRLSHRLLLILVPQDLNRAPQLAGLIESREGWGVARRDLDHEVDPETSVYIADAGQEYGLWYRLAPITYLGGSLLGNGSARSPLEAAALGSAIIHGRKVGAFGQAFGRLGAALGAAAISTPAELAGYLAELMAPDRVARIAHAAWGVASEGAEVTDRIVQTVRHLAKGQG